MIEDYDAGVKRAHEFDVHFAKSLTIQTVMAGLVSAIVRNMAAPRQGLESRRRPLAPAPAPVSDDNWRHVIADVHLQLCFGADVKLGHRFDQGKCGVDRTLSVLLLCTRIAEIGEHAVAPVAPGNKTSTLNQFSAAKMKGADDPLSTLEIDPSTSQNITVSWRLGAVWSGRGGAGVPISTLPRRELALHRSA